MKPVLATALSISGVFAAGATAFAVNSAVLVAPPGSFGASPSAATVDSSQIVPGVTLAPASQSGPASNMAVSPAAVKPTGILAQTDTSASYAVGEAGTVVVDMVDGLPVIVSVAPGSGWTAQVRPATAITREAAVIFTGPTSRVIFEVDIANGRFDVDVDSTPLVSAPRQDDDDHDEHDEDEDEDDDHDEDDDDHDDD